jgi:hypothetical protein
MKTESAVAWVKDKNALNEPREHDLVWPDGKMERFAFEPRAFREIPMVLATRWLVGNGGFEVREGGPGGPILKLVAQKQEAAQGPGFVMRPDQVVATLDELTLDALLARVQKAGGTLARQAGKKALIEFLVTGDAPMDVDRAPAGEPSFAKASEGGPLGTLVNAA